MSERTQETETSAFPLILGIFLLSGAAGLLYEIAWFRRLQMVFGVSAFAVGAVVTAFMLGLATGSRWAGSAVGLRRRPLVGYAILETAIGAWALLFPGLVILTETLYSSVFGLLGEHFLVLSLLRLVLSVVILQPATFFMGATFPTLVRVVMKGEEQDCAEE